MLKRAEEMGCWIIRPGEQKISMYGLFGWCADDIQGVLDRNAIMRTVAV